ncbi:MAG: hypothetical protein RRC34_15490 [Lentisphaeria bacterium]|nr:hypothetical protein [Lentisphaeria bacterium]
MCHLRSSLRRIIVDIAEKAGLGGEVTAHVFRRDRAIERVKDKAISIASAGASGTFSKTSDMSP